MVNRRKVVIIGDGAVGSTTAYTLFLTDIATDIVIIDVNKKKVVGDVLDMQHGMSLINPKNIKAGEYKDVKGAQIVVITAGVGQKPGETRLDLLKRNISVFDNIIDNMKPYLDEGSIILIVTNPVDILTYYTYKKLNLPSSRVIGSGTVLDTARQKLLISQMTKIDPRNVHTFVVGEHGDSEVSAFSSSRVGGVELVKYMEKNCETENCVEKDLNKLHESVKNAAYEIIDAKGATFYAVAMAVVRIIGTIINNTNSVLTVSTYVESYFDGEIKDVYFALPCKLNAKGIEQIIDIDYNKDEKAGLIKSANTLKTLINELGI